MRFQWLRRHEDEYRRRAGSQHECPGPNVGRNAEDRRHETTRMDLRSESQSHSDGGFVTPGGHAVADVGMTGHEQCVRLWKSTHDNGWEVSVGETPEVQFVVW